MKKDRCIKCGAVRIREYHKNGSLKKKTIHRTKNKCLHNWIENIQKYIVEYGVPGGVIDCNTVEDLERYLIKVPHPIYRLVNTQFVHGNYIIIWELKNE